MLHLQLLLRSNQQLCGSFSIQLRSFNKKKFPKAFPSSLIFDDESKYKNIRNNPGLNNRMKIQEEYGNENFEKLPSDEDDWSLEEFASNEEEKNFNIKKIIERKKRNKNFREPNFLTWAAKEQIRYLHRTDPDEWTPEKLSQCFPTSIEGIKKLLKSSFVIRDKHKIRLHDLAVAKRWHEKNRVGGPLIVPEVEVDVPCEEETFSSSISKNVLAPKIGEFSKIVSGYYGMKSSKATSQVSKHNLQDKPKFDNSHVTAEKFLKHKKKN